ncbi:MAG: hypothetical protein R3B45_05010 [Bdellovibrionota bacterium]
MAPHTYNKTSMKEATILATLQRLGVVPSFSRPKVSDDKPFAESLFKTLRCRPEYPSKLFSSFENARGHGLALLLNSITINIFIAGLNLLLRQISTWVRMTRYCIKEKWYMRQQDSRPLIAGLEKQEIDQE